MPLGLGFLRSCEASGQTLPVLLKHLHYSDSEEEPEHFLERRSGTFLGELKHPWILRQDFPSSGWTQKAAWVRLLACPLLHSWAVWEEDWVARLHRRPSWWESLPENTCSSALGLGLDPWMAGRACTGVSQAAPLLTGFFRGKASVKQKPVRHNLECLQPVLERLV